MTRRNPFKVGDRIRVFTSIYEERAVILDVSINMLQVKWHHPDMQKELDEWVHYRQCVRLVKKGEQKRCELFNAIIFTPSSRAIHYCLTHRRDADVCREKGLRE